MMIRVAALLGLLSSVGAVTAAPPAGPTPVAATRYSLVDTAKVEHASLSMTLWTREVVLYGADAYGVEVAAQDGSQIDVNALTHSIRLGATQGVDVFGGVPLTVEGGPGATVNADGGYRVAGTPGWSGAVPLPGAACLVIQGGLVVAYRPPGQGCP